MQNTPQPREHRIALATDVRIFANDGDPPLEGQTINLSRSGVLVESNHAWTVGTEIVCEFPTSQGARPLRGRVSRVEPLAEDGERVRVAVQFVELEQPELELLSRLLNETGGAFHLVRVRFEGMRDPMRARAMVTEEGIHLSTSLAFLRLGSPVEVTFPAGSDWPASRGKVVDVQLDRHTMDGVPRLAVQVERTEELATPPVAAATATGRRRWAFVDRRQARGLLGVAAGLVLALLGAWAIQRSLSSKDGSVAQAPAGQPPPLAAPATAPPLRPANVRAPAPGPVAATPGTTASPATAPVTAEPAAGATERAPVFIPAPLPPGTPGPQVNRTGQETTATVAVTGSTAGMSHYSLADRRGLSVILPRARAGVPPGLHRVQHDGLAYVWIRERREGGLHIRFVFTSPPPDERLLELDEDAVRIRVRLPAPPVGATTPQPFTEPPTPPAQASRATPTLLPAAAAVDPDDCALDALDDLAGEEHATGSRPAALDDGPVADSAF